MIFSRGGGEIFEELRAKHGQILYPPRQKISNPLDLFNRESIQLYAKTMTI